MIGLELKSLKADDKHGRSASVKLNGQDITQQVRGIIITAKVDDAIRAHLDILAYEGVDITLPAVEVVLNVTAIPGYTLLVEESNDGTQKRYKAVRDGE
jgi:hypothetical protein